MLLCQFPPRRPSWCWRWRYWRLRWHSSSRGLAALLVTQRNRTHHCLGRTLWLGMLQCAASCSQLICRSACSIMQRQCWGRDGAETTAGDLSCHRPLPTLTLVTKLLQYINNTTLQPPSSVALSLHINCIALEEILTYIKNIFLKSVIQIQCDKGEHNAKL